jgi:hypothetical protein
MESEKRKSLRDFLNDKMILCLKISEPYHVIVIAPGLNATTLFNVII